MFTCLTRRSKFTNFPNSLIMPILVNICTHKSIVMYTTASSRLTNPNIK